MFRLSTWKQICDFSTEYLAYLKQLPALKKSEMAHFHVTCKTKAREVEAERLQMERQGYSNEGLYTKGEFHARIAMLKEEQEWYGDQIRWTIHRRIEIDQDLGINEVVGNQFIGEILKTGISLFKKQLPRLPRDYRRRVWLTLSSHHVLSSV